MGSSDSKGATAKERIPKEKMIPKEKKSKEIPEVGRRCRKWQKRIAMIHRVDIPRRQKEKGTGAIESTNGALVSSAGE